MIFVCVGTQFPFDRMVCAVDRWAQQQGRSDVTGQIGKTTYVPKAITYHAFIEPAEYRHQMEQSSLIVAHAGIGSILSALELCKPIIILPRDPARGEHRNAHQIATAERFKAIRGVHVAQDEEALLEYLNHPERIIPPSSPLSDKAPQALIDGLKAFINQ